VLVVVLLLDPFKGVEAGDLTVKTPPESGPETQRSAKDGAPLRLCGGTIQKMIL